MGVVLTKKVFQVKNLMLVLSLGMVVVSSSYVANASGSPILTSGTGLHIFGSTVSGVAVTSANADMQNIAVQATFSINGKVVESPASSDEDTYVVSVFTNDYTYNSKNTYMTRAIHTATDYNNNSYVLSSSCTKTPTTYYGKCAQ